MSRALPSKDSEIISTPCEEVLPELCRFLSLSRTCFGIHGAVIHVRNEDLDHITSTSVCKRILQTMSFPHPLLKLVCVAVDQHLQNYLDYGLFTVNLCLSLFCESMVTDIHKKLVCDALDLFCAEVLDILKVNLAVQVPVDTSCHLDMKKVTRAVISSKRNCALLTGDLEHLQNMVIDVFTKTRHVRLKDAEEVIEYIMVEGKEVRDSLVAEGVLLPDPSLSTDAKIWKNNLQNNGVAMRVVMLDISMAGDSEDFNCNFAEDSQAAVGSAVLEKMKRFVEACAEKQVDLLLCQKVIHPLMKRYLKEKQVKFLERLGKKPFLASLKVAGCTPLSSFQSRIESCHIGCIAQVEHCVFNETSYMHLSGGAQSHVYTAVLCHLTDEPLEEMMAVFQAALHCLRILQIQPQALPGGGCWQAVITRQAFAEVDKYKHDWADKLGCDAETVVLLLKSFLSSLFVAGVSKEKNCHVVVDNNYFHSWRIYNYDDEPASSTCSCGAVSKTDGLQWVSAHDLLQLRDHLRTSNTADFSTCDILDCSATAQNAVLTALSLAKALLGVHAVVVDNS